jgi:hypothetical protein
MGIYTIKFLSPGGFEHSTKGLLRVMCLGFKISIFDLAID